MNTGNYHKELRRENTFLNGTSNFFSNYTSRPRLLLEVFVRKNFGVSYFNMGSVISVAWRVAIFPLLVYYTIPVFRYLFSGDWHTAGDFWPTYAGWYILLAFFMVFAVIRWTEVLKIGDDTPELSSYDGDLNPFFTKFDFLGEATPKNISIRYEPLMFFVIGFLLKFLGQNVGWLIMISSIFYSVGYYAAYRYSDSAIRALMDKVKRTRLKKAIYDSISKRKELVAPDGSPLMERKSEDDEPIIVR